MSSLTDHYAEQHLPISAFKITRPDGTSGWVYSVTTEWGDTFELFLYFDHCAHLHRVLLVSPNIEDLGVAHTTHLFSDGHLCISPNGYGSRFVHDAYARSVLWCNGISSLLRGHGFGWGQ